MKSLIWSLLLVLYCSTIFGAEWGSVNDFNRIGYVVPAPVYYVIQPQQVVIPVVPIVPQIQYVPVVVYGNVIVEKQYCCLFKRYEVTPVTNVVYVPIWK